ncbi:hypothetical protein ABW19_dt0201712 [Dactylella cylindrospora]|nr:hypothetical protein ABW19_dt0201712 [Dactylella cylindrospora]
MFSSLKPEFEYALPQTTKFDDHNSKGGSYTRSRNLSNGDGFFYNSQSYQAASSRNMTSTTGNMSVSEKMQMWEESSSHVSPPDSRKAYTSSRNYSSTRQIAKPNSDRVARFCFHCYERSCTQVCWGCSSTPYEYTLCPRCQNCCNADCIFYVSPRKVGRSNPNADVYFLVTL